MYEKPVLKSRNRIALVIFLLLMCAGFIFFSVASVLSGCFNIKDGGGIGTGIFWSAFGLFGIFCFYGVVDEYNSLVIYEDRLEVISVFGKIKKVICLKDIVGYTEEEKGGDNWHWTLLTIYTDTSSFAFSATIYRNYKDIRDLLVKDKQKNDPGL